MYSDHAAKVLKYKLICLSVLFSASAGARLFPRDRAQPALQSTAGTSQLRTSAVPLAVAVPSDRPRGQPGWQGRALSTAVTRSLCVDAWP